MPEKRTTSASSSSKASSSTRARHAAPVQRSARKSEKDPKKPAKKAPARTFHLPSESLIAERVAIPRTALIVLLAIVLCVAIAVVLVRTASGASTNEVVTAQDYLVVSEPDFSETMLVRTGPSLDALTPALIDSLEAEEGIFGFALTDDGAAPTAEAPIISEEHLGAIEKALAPYEKNGIDASFFLVDASSGRGMAYQLDRSVYAASSFKGPYCAFLCAEYLDEGDSRLDAVIDCDPESCTTGTSADGEDNVRNLMASTILYSSNEAYGSLRSAFSSKKLESWLESIGVSGSKAYEMRLPFFAVRDMAKMWAQIHAYLDTESEHAAFLEDLFSKTEMSFIRDALEESESSAVRVLNKGGWYRPDDSTFDAVVDCGIVACEDRDYLLCVMTGAHWNQENVNRAETLISAVFAARSDLI